MTSEKEHKLFQLAQQFLERTERGEISWRETTSEDRFYAALDRAAIEIERIEYNDEDGVTQFVYRLNLLNPGGRLAEEFAPREDEYGRLSRLFQAARSSARKGDQLVDTLLKDYGI